MSTTPLCPLVQRLQAQVRHFCEVVPPNVTYRDIEVDPQDLYAEDGFLGALMYAASVHAQNAGSALRIGCIPDERALLGWIPTLTGLPPQAHPQLHTLWWHYMHHQLERLVQGTDQEPKRLDGLCTLMVRARERGSAVLMELPSRPQT